MTRRAAARRGSAPPRRPAPASTPHGPAWRIAGLVALVIGAGAEVFRLGFFADDFHFLDVARRIPLARTLGGQYGIYPWFRPLSRELYFAVLVHAGPLGLALSHLVQLAALAGAVLLLLRIGARVAGERAAAIGAALFATYAFTRFLLGWASGFQDLAALLLVLLALDAQARGRSGWAIAFATLAPLAKETGFLAFPLLLAQAVLVDGERRPRRWMVGQTIAFVAVAALHVAVRVSWHAGGTAARLEPSAWSLAAALGQVVAGFVGGAPVLTPVAIACALLAAAGTGLLLGTARDRDRHATRASAIAFAGVAALLGIAPLVTGSLRHLTLPHAYYAFAAAPWLALLLGAALARVPARPGTAVAVVLVGWNALALGYEAPDLGAPSSWRFRRWDWPEAERISAVSERLTGEVRDILASRPESLVVLYRGLAVGSFFQTEDGPATREALRDPTVRAYWVNDPPYGLRRGRYALLEFDTGARRLSPSRLRDDSLATFAATGIALGRPARAWAFANYRDPMASPALGSRFTLSYLRACAALVGEGVAGFQRELGSAGLLDSTGAQPARIAHGVMTSLPAAEAGLRSMLEHPLNAAAHAAFADTLLAIDASVSAAIELRVAAQLDPSRLGDRLRLARALLGLHTGRDAAREELERLAVDARGTPLEEEARRTLAALPRAAD